MNPAVPNSEAATHVPGYLAFMLLQKVQPEDGVITYVSNPHVMLYLGPFNVDLYSNTPNDVQHTAICLTEQTIRWSHCHRRQLVNCRKQLSATLLWVFYFAVL